MYPADSVVFDRRNFLFGYSWPYNFCRSIWSRSSRQWLYVLYRFVIFAWFLAWEINDIMIYVNKGKGPYYLIYLTHWSWMVQWWHTILALIVAIWGCWFASEPKYEEGYHDSQWEPQLPWFVKLHWIIREAAFAMSIVISIMFWTMLYSPTIKEYQTFVNWNQHLINSIYVLLDIAISAAPIRLFHFWIPVIFGAIYSIFTGFYYAAGGTRDDNNGTFIYSVIDYGNKPGMASGIVIGFTFVFAPVGHAFLAFLYWLNALLAKSVFRKTGTSRVVPDSSRYSKGSNKVTIATIP